MFVSSFRSSLEIIDKYFNQLLEEQDFFGTEKQWSKVLALLPTQTASQLHDEWKENIGMSSIEKWGRIIQEVQNKSKIILDEIQLQWSYPRLDVNVSKGVNHLLKSPLCVHPKTGQVSTNKQVLTLQSPHCVIILHAIFTGRICVPIDVKRVDEFDPFVVPTVSQICHEFEILDPERQETASDKKLG